MSNKTGPFDLADIQDVRIIVKAKDKHWSLVPKEDKPQARLKRILAAVNLLETHYIVDKPLEDIVSDETKDKT